MLLLERLYFVKYLRKFKTRPFYGFFSIFIHL